MDLPEFRGSATREISEALYTTGATCQIPPAPPSPLKMNVRVLT